MVKIIIIITVLVVLAALRVIYDLKYRNYFETKQQFELRNKNKWEKKNGA